MVDKMNSVANSFFREKTIAMCSAEALHRWSSDSPVKAKSAHVSHFRVTMKDSAGWYSRISRLILFGIFLGAGAVFGVIATLNTVGYPSNPESGILVARFTAETAEPSQEEFLSIAREEPSRKPVPISSTGTTHLNTSSFDDEYSYEDRAEALSSSSNITLMPHRVNLKRLSDVYHDMSEAELLWRASVGAMRRPRPDSVIPKVAYLFLTRGALPLRPLWERYFKGHGDLYSIYVHAHPNFLPDVPPNSAFYRRNIPSEEVYWGKVSVFAAERRLLANALLNPANERFVLLSESCIPIASLPMAYHYFMKSAHSFVDAYFLDGKGGQGRYIRIKDRRKLNPEVTLQQWRKGSQWFEMARDMALLVVSDRKYYPKLEKLLCMNDCICYMDEHYLPTVLTILAPSKLANRTSHFIDFARSTAHPYQWERERINRRTLRGITSGHQCWYNGKNTTTCHMFARKFSPKTLKPLLELAATSFGIP